MTDPYLAYLDSRIETINRRLDDAPPLSRQHARLSGEKTALLGARARYKNVTDTTTSA